MEPDYSATLVKAKTYFNKMLKDREKYMQKMPLDLPKRIEIETLPIANAEVVENDKTEAKHHESETKQQHETETKHHHETETKHHHETETKHHPESETKHHHGTEKKHHPESENIGTSRPKSSKKKLGNNAKQPKTKVKSFELRKMNDKTEVGSKNRSSSKSIIKSSSISTVDSPISNSIKVSTSSSTARINQKCYEAIQKAKNYFETRDTAKFRKKPPSNVTKANETTKVEDNKKQTDSIVYNVGIHRNNTEESATKKGQSINQKKVTSIETQPSAKKYFKSHMGIDQKSINVRKENKDKTNRNNTKIKTFPNAPRENKKGSRSESPQLITGTLDQISDHLTPAKRYLRSKLGMDEKVSTNMRKDITKNNFVSQDTSAATDTKTGSQQEPTKPGTKLQSTTAVKVRQPISTRPVSNDTETNLKKLSAAPEKQAIENRQTNNPSIRVKGTFSTKTDIVTNIEPVRETNKLSIELKRPIILTSSTEKLIAKALKIGLKKINCTGLQDLQIKIHSSSQSRNNFSVFDQCRQSERSDLVSMQSLLESKISAFQTEMERRQKQTFNKIQELENTIQYRKQQLLEVNKSKNKALQNYEKTKPQ